MPAAQPKPSVPRASRKKRASHAFYLLQPFFQFLTLILVVFAFVRCSPLAPSTDKSPVGAGGLGGSGGGLSGGAGGLSAMAIQQNLQELSAKLAKVVSESDFRKATDEVKSADDSLDESQVKSIFENHRGGMLGHNQKLFFLNLSADNLAALLRDGKVQVDLSQRLAHASAKGKNELFSNLQTAAKASALDATGYVVMPDGSMQSAQKEYADISLPLKISYSSPAAGKAFLVIETTPDSSEADQTNAALLEDAAKQARSLAVVLE